MAVCNLKYSKENSEQLRKDLKLLYFQINNPNIENRIVQLLQRKYSNKDGDNKHVLLSDLTDEDSIDFKKCVYDTVCTLDNNSIGNLSPKAKKFINIVLSTFFDINSAEEVVIQESEQDKSMETDEAQQARITQKIDDVLLDIYGPINTGLIQDLTESFNRELKQLLVYNTYLKTKYELTQEQVNNKIVQYKERKFRKILKFLKQKYQDDSFLQSISSIYSNGVLNASQYYYVLDKFKKFILSYPDRGIKLNEELEDKILQKARIEQETKYQQLINKLLSIPALKTWFDNRYPTNMLKQDARTTLFYANTFSNYYQEIKDKIDKEIKNGNDYNELLTFFEQIENPENSLLNYVNDYIYLTQFDDLVRQNLGHIIGIEKGFLSNVEPQQSKAQKYIIKEAHNHQKASWGDANSDNSEKHTSSNVKDILSTIHIYKYNGTHELIPQTLDVSFLIQSWQSFVSDIRNGFISFDTSNKAVKDVIKQLLDTESENVIDNIIEVLEILYKPNKIANSRGRMIDIMQNENLFSEIHKNVLYSFYNSVLNKDNPNSNISIELQKVNDNVTYSSKFLETTTALTSVLYRNVDNNYIACDTSTKNTSFSIKRKFNWDSDLFDLVESINFQSKMRQMNTLSGRLQKYKYFTNTLKGGEYLSGITLNGKKDSYQFSFRYKQNGHDNPEGLFSSANNVKFEGSEVDDKSILDILADINIKEFKNKLLSNDLNEYETVFRNLLEVFDYYLQTNFLSDKGLDILWNYKEKYKADASNNLYSKNYLNHLLKLALRVADIDYEIQSAGNKNFKEYLSNDSKYASLVTRESKRTNSPILDIQANKIFFKAVTTKDKALSDIARIGVEVAGRSIRSTSLNKAGDSVANYSISRLGSEVDRRLYDQSQQNGPSQTLLFVKYRNALDTTPVIDAEITTLIGDVKAVKDTTSAELFQHAIFDKFYNSYQKNEKICFQPTVYSDKTTFLNYLSNLSMFSEGVMNLMNNTEEEFIDMYRNTFYAAHNYMQVSIVNKLNKLVTYLQSSPNKKSEDVFAGRMVDNVTTLLKNRTEEELMQLVYEYNLANTDKIELEKDIDYRVRGNHCTLNEIISFYAKLYNNPKRLRNFLKKQENIFANQLKSYCRNFTVFNSYEEITAFINNKLEKPTYIAKILSDTSILEVKDRENFVKQWIEKDTGELIIQKDGQLNPFFQKFFYIEGIFSNNLRLSLSGSEVNHPDKAKKTLFNQIKSLSAKILQEEDLTNKKKLTLELQELLSNNQIKTNINEVINIITKVDNIDDLDGVLQDIYDLSIVEIINTAEGTQFKRNVIIPATLQHLTTGLINGVANEVNAAVIYDMQAPVNNLRESDTIDSQDGSARMSPIQVILENNSLDDQRVGTNRKPIWDDQTSNLSSFLAKFAVFGYTNAMMIQSLKSTSSDYNMFKKMHNIRWNGTIDITKNINQVEATRYKQENVSRWFKEAILNNQKLFYRNHLGDKVQITDFGKDENGYFTIEKVFGQQEQKIYHYFDDNSEHYTTFKEGLHTIDSLYELFLSMGGINCIDNDGKVSEFSHKVLTNFVINVGSKVNKKVTSTKDIIQPLKDKFIAYVFNSSAVKNGAKNINNAERWTDNNSLNTFKLSVKGLGIQLNADHDVVDQELTEFSQVISACAAYGKDYRTVNEIYYGLAKSAFEASEQELTNIEKFFKDYATDPSKAKYKLYKIVGKLIVQSKSNNDMDLTERLKSEIKDAFKIEKDDITSELKIPFSDPSIYSQFITNISSVINKKSIKRKHPGSGFVMAPGYNVVQYFQMFDSKTKQYRKYLFADVLKRARYDFKNKLQKELKKWCSQNNIDPNQYGERKLRVDWMSLTTLVQEAKDKIDIPYLHIATTDVTEYNKQLVDMFLNSKQNEEQLRDKSWFMPTDIVQVITPTGELGQVIDLSDMKTYYDFKNRKELEGTQFKLCVIKPNNLKPSLIRWQYVDPADGITKYMTIYDHPIIRGSWNLPKEQRPKQAEIQQVLDLLDEGKFELNGQLIDIVPNSLENTEAEVVLGNMYKDIFQTGDASLADIMDQGENFFKKQTEVPKIPSGFYNLAFVKANGQHTLITFSNLKETINVYEDEFTDEEVNEQNEIYSNGIKIGKYIEETIKDNLGNTIPKYKYIDGKVFDQSGNEFTKYKLVVDKNGNVEKILSRVDYLKRYKFLKSETVNGQQQVATYTLYKVAPIQDIIKALEKKGDRDVLNSDGYKQISSILEHIFNQDKFIDIQINTGTVTDSNIDLKRVVANSLINFGNDTKYVKEQNKRVPMTQEEIRKLPRFQQHIISIREALLSNNFEEQYINEINGKENGLRKQYYDYLQQPRKQYSSFLTSLHFISSRIPAQSLQSFMPMICVGWTNDTSNTAYVSYIQTYLQGSDY